MAALETTLFVSAKTSKDSKYQWYDYVRMLEHFSTFGRLWMLDQQFFYLQNIWSQLFKANFLHGEGNCTTIFSFSKRCKHYCNYFNVVISSINPCSSVKYSSSHHLVKKSKCFIECQRISNSTCKSVDITSTDIQQIRITIFQPFEPIILNICRFI